MKNSEIIEEEYIIPSLKSSHSKHVEEQKVSRNKKKRIHITADSDYLVFEQNKNRIPKTIKQAKPPKTKQ